MELSVVIDTLVGLVIGGLAWFLNTTNKKQEKLSDLISETREQYLTKSEAHQTMTQLLTSIQRVEDKLDRVLERKEPV